MAKVSKEIEDKMNVIRKMLGVNGLLNEADELNLDMLEKEFVLYEQCSKAIEKYGLVLSDGRGSMKINPAASARNKSANTILCILKEFGISAKSRKAILEKDVDEHEESALQTYMKSIR